MKKIILLFLLSISTITLFAQNEIGPEGHKLVWVFGIIIVLALFIAFFLIKNKTKVKSRNPLLKRTTIRIGLDKDALYYPDNLKLTVKNAGNTDVDLDRPLLVFDNFWLKRKFRLKGMGNRTLYPLYLEKRKSHHLDIDLTRFYSHDKSLKKFPKAKVVVYDIKGKRLGSKSVYLRKTLLKF
ncbi:MAG: hypothetical protein ABFS16_04630 [Bacteroidota bacterium]